jgi:hypothetical protein
MGGRLVLPGWGARSGGFYVISVGAITKRANDERMPAQTIERDYVLAQLWEKTSGGSASGYEPPF